MNYCKYSEIFGKAEQGFHAARIGGFALWDIVGTIALAGAISSVTGNFLAVLIVLIIIAIWLHWLFCVPTKLNKVLGIYTMPA